MSKGEKIFIGFALTAVVTMQAFLLWQWNTLETRTKSLKSPMSDEEFLTAFDEIADLTATTVGGLEKRVAALEVKPSRLVLGGDREPGAVEFLTPDGRRAGVLTAGWSGVGQEPTLFLHGPSDAFPPAIRLSDSLWLMQADKVEAKKVEAVTVEAYTITETASR